MEGNAPLAAAYAINIIAIFQTYRWNHYVSTNQQSPGMWHGLVDNDQWQASYLQGDSLAELQFWLGDVAAVAAPVAAAAAASSSGATAIAAGSAPVQPSRKKAHTASVRGHRAATPAKASSHPAKKGKK